MTGYDELPLEEMEATFKQELVQAAEWSTEVRNNEVSWINDPKGPEKDSRVATRDSEVESDSRRGLFTNNQRYCSLAIADKDTAWWDRLFCFRPRPSKGHAGLEGTPHRSAKGVEIRSRPPNPEELSVPEAPAVSSGYPDKPGARKGMKRIKNYKLRITRLRVEIEWRS